MTEKTCGGKVIHGQGEARQGQRQMSQGQTRNYLVKIGQQPGEEGRARKYDPIYCDQVRLWAAEGLFPETWCARIGIHPSTLYRWANEYPDFEEAAKQAWVILEDYWSRFLQNNLTNTDLRVTALIPMLRQRFPHIWGKVPRGTLDHFLQRNVGSEPAPTQQPTETQQAAVDPATPRDSVLQRIREIEERMKHRKEA